MNTQKLNSAIAGFTKKKKSNAAYYEENWAERKERKGYYQSFTKDKLMAMTEDEFLEYVSKLRSMLIWGNKKLGYNDYIKVWRCRHEAGPIQRVFERVFAG